jgi:hypothetical protein
MEVFTLLRPKVVECRLCPGRVCTPITWGRKINDTGKANPSLDEIKAVSVSIQDCELRESLEAEDNKLELGC